MPKIAKRRTMWFDMPDDPVKGRIEVAHLTAGDVAEIRDQSMTLRNVFDAESGKPVSEQRIDLALDRQLTVCAAVRGWENFMDEGGRQMPCTDENKRLWAREDGFMAFLNQCREKLATLVQEERESATKN